MLQQSMHASTGEQIGVLHIGRVQTFRDKCPYKLAQPHIGMPEPYLGNLGESRLDTGRIAHLKNLSGRIWVAQEP